MLYRQLIQFDPIDTVIQLRESDDRSEAEHLVSTYVISPRMGERIADVLIPNLQFDERADQKGILIVGNYGTGKSHLMAVIGAIAEHADLADKISNNEVRDAAHAIAGRFQVVRMEIGATQMPLRDIVLGELEEALADRGIGFEFPSMTEVSNTKDSLIEMMAKFQEHFPDQGLLVVLDELLDYLRGRDDQPLVLDLNFLRELGEVCETTRFRFIGGVQESLFDSSRFQFAADSVRRVRDRFEQMRIAREDVSFVVAQRLLKKTDDQKAWVRQYLQRFEQLYPKLPESLDSFVELFPIHPAYIDVFEQIHVVERREILRTLSRTMTAILDEPVPDDRPGVISFDTYWDVLRSNPSYRTISTVRDVIVVSEQLEAKIESAFTRPAYKPIAIPIIHALSVQRLTLANLRDPIGMTPAELRDSLLLHIKLPMEDADFLKQTIESTLREIHRTVSGSYITQNRDNGQWYIDLDKDIDYDKLIEDRAESLSANQLNRYYYDVVQRLMEVVDVDPYVRGARIWSYEVLWRDRNVTRPGYLFFGAPNERSTAQPPREFYLYFLQPYETPDFTDERTSDEVFFRLIRQDEDFNRWLRLYAAARELQNTASTEQDVYRAKASSRNAMQPGYFERLLDWFQENMSTAIEVSYQGTNHPAAELFTGRIESFKDMIDQTATATLGRHFDDLHPDYPRFPIRLTRQNRDQAALEAIRGIAGPILSRQATDVLSALELVDGDRIRTDNSRYARYVKGQLQAQGEGKVLNRSDLIESLYGGEVERDTRFHLEPELFAVVLVALAYTGDAAIAVDQKKIDAGSLDDVARLSLESITGFRYVERPRDVPMAALTALFDMLGLQTGLLKSPQTHGDAVEALQKAINSETERAVTNVQWLRNGITCWNATIIEGSEREQLISALDEYREFLDSLRSIKTAGHLRNFRHTTDEVRMFEQARQLLLQVDGLTSFLPRLQTLATYLLQARHSIGNNRALSDQLDELEKLQTVTLRDPEKRYRSEIRDVLVKDAEELKDAYVDDYIRRHNRSCLTIEGDRRRKDLLQSQPVQRLQAISAVDILPDSKIDGLRREITELRMCSGVTPRELDSTPFCPLCHYQPDAGAPVINASDQLDRLADQLEDLEREWTATLLDNLEDPMVRETLGLLHDAERQPVESFMTTRELPKDIDRNFIQALQSAFSDLERVTIERNDLATAISNGGSPSTVDELATRLDEYLDHVIGSKDRRRIRIVIE